MEKEFIFKCKKCYHNVYVERGKIEKLLKSDCPECGEEADELWILLGRGYFSEFKGLKITFERGV